MSRDKSDVVDAEMERLRGVESLADTPFARLFHEARTSTPHSAERHGYNQVTIQVRVSESGEIETSEPVKTRKCQHLRGTERYDGKISLTVKPFLDVRTARKEIVRQLRDLARSYARREQREQERQETQEMLESEGLDR